MGSIIIDGSLVLDSRMDSINQIEKLIDSQSQMLNIDDEVYGKYMLAVVESVNNAIVHGNKMSSEKQVYVHYHIADERIEVSVRDEGDGFDPDALPDPTAEDNIMKDCGRGIFLMRHLADDLTFENHGRVVRLVFNLQ